MSYSVVHTPQGKDGEHDGVLDDGAEDAEDAGHDEPLDGVEAPRGSSRGICPENKEFDYQFLDCPNQGLGDLLIHCSYILVVLSFCP